MQTDTELPSTRCRNVLVVDDEMSIHTMYDLFLQPDQDDLREPGKKKDVFVDSPHPSRNFDVLHAAGGQEAINIGKSRAARGRPIQLAFVDMKMSEKDGIETIRELYEIDPRTIFVIATGFAEAAYEKIGSELGAIPVQVIPKPFEMSGIYQTAVQMCLRWERLHR